jgi:hypothetical protein
MPNKKEAKTKWSKLAKYSMEGYTLKPVVLLMMLRVTESVFSVNLYELRDLRPRANYADRAIAACRRS